MVLFSKAYWNQRVKQYGHTGYADPFLYCFDQEARKFVLRELLQNTRSIKYEKALDFGCGSGDFAEVLDQFKSIVGYDFSDQVLEIAKKNPKHSHVNFTDQIEKTAGFSPFDLVLTVTVLQSMDLHELKTAISQICSWLANTGRIICMEFFSTEENNRTRQIYRITRQEWQTVLQENNLEIVNRYFFYNSLLAPVGSWKQYNGNLFLKSLKPFARFDFVKQYLSYKAREIINKERDVLLSENSNFDIYILQKNKHEH